MQEFPFLVEFWQNGWRFECDVETLEEAIDEAKELHHRTDMSCRVVSPEGDEVFRTDGKSDFTNR